MSPREVPSTLPPLEQVKLAPGEVVTAKDMGDLVRLQNFIYSQAGSRVGGRVWDPFMFVDPGPTLVATYLFKVLKRQGGPNSYYYTAQASGDGVNVRFEFRDPVTDVLVGLIELNPAGTGTGEANVVTTEEMVKLLVYVDYLGAPGTISQFSVSAAPLDPARDW